MLVIDFQRFLAELEDLTGHQTQVASRRLKSKDEGLEVAKIAELSFAHDPKCPRCDSPALMR